MSEDRRRSVARIVRLQDKIATLAAFRLARAEAAEAEIVAAREDLQRFVDTAALTGAFALFAAGRTRALSAEALDAGTRRAALAKDRQAAETRLKLAQRLGDAVTREADAAAERKTLERMIEEAVGRGERE